MLQEVEVDSTSIHELFSDDRSPVVDSFNMSLLFFRLSGKLVYFLAHSDKGTVLDLIVVLL